MSPISFDQILCSLLHQDSVPKFIKHPKYAQQLRGLDAAAAAAYAAGPNGSSRP
jgi:hypothetical protein